MTDSFREITLGTRLAVNPHLVLRIEDDDCALLFDPDSGRVDMLNDTAVAIWQRLDGQKTLQEVLESLSDEYDGIDLDAEQQVLHLVQNLARVGAVGLRGAEWPPTR